MMFRFQQFDLDPRERRLTRAGDVVRLEPKSLDLLIYLVENAGRLVEKQELVDAVWASAVVTDNSLTRAMHHLRTALEDSADAPIYIETVPGAGYRFIAPVDRLDEPTDRTAATARTRRRSAIAVASAAGLAAMLWVTFTADDPPSASIERLAVLPLLNLTGDPDQQYFVQGVHDALITDISKIEELEVISRTSVMRFTGDDATIPEIARQLGVDAVIEGSIMRDGDEITLTTQLIGTDPERHVWAERYDGEVGTVFEMTANVASAVAAEVLIDLSAAERQMLAAARQVDGEAYDAYLRARYFFESRTPDGYRKAADLYRQAMQRDPDFAPAYVGLAHTLGSAAIFGARRPADSMPAARELADKAIRIDDQLAEAHQILAGVSFYWDWDWPAAEQGARRTLALNPNSANAYRFLSEVYAVTGRHEEALIAVERGRELDPLPPIAQIKPSLILYLQRDYPAAIRRARGGLEFYPRFWQGHWLLCLSSAAVDQHDEAIEACESAVQLSARAPMALGALGYAYALAGQDDAAKAIISELEALREGRYVGAANLAIIHGALGDLDTAFTELEQAYQDRDQLLIHVENYGFFDPLRADPRFHSLKIKHFRPAGKANVTRS